jgi:hypothetical protein
LSHVESRLGLHLRRLLKNAGPPMACPRQQDSRLEQQQLAEDPKRRQTEGRLAADPRGLACQGAWRSPAADVHEACLAVGCKGQQECPAASLAASRGAACHVAEEAAGHALAADHVAFVLHTALVVHQKDVD